MARTVTDGAIGAHLTTPFYYGSTRARWNGTTTYYDFVSTPISGATEGYLRRVVSGSVTNLSRGASVQTWTMAIVGSTLKAISAESATHTVTDAAISGPGDWAVAPDGNGTAAENSFMDLAGATFYDTFDRADETPIGSPWTATEARPPRLYGKRVETAADGGWGYQGLARNDAVSMTDGTVKVAVSYGQRVGVCARVTSNTHRYFTMGDRRCWKVVAGAWTNLGTATSGTYTGQALTCTGATITYQPPASNPLVITDASIASGSVGMTAEGPAGSYMDLFAFFPAAAPALLAPVFGTINALGRRLIT